MKISKGRRKKKKISFYSPFLGVRNTFLRRSPVDFSHFVDWLILGPMSIPELITDKGELTTNQSWAYSRPVGHGPTCGWGEWKAEQTQDSVRYRKKIGIVLVTTSILLNLTLAVIL